MMSNDFEEAFGSFLERKEYDEAESALFAMVRTAFLAGWKAAGGDPPTPQTLFFAAKALRADSLRYD